MYSVDNAAIRIAECMGLYRDPPNMAFRLLNSMSVVLYGIKYAMYLDLKTSEDQGPRPYISCGWIHNKAPVGPFFIKATSVS